MKAANMVELGFCKSPHGIKGEFSFSLYNKDSSVLKKKTQVLLVPHTKSSSIKPEGEYFEISQIKFGNKVIARLTGIEDRNQVEAMIPFSIHLSRDKFPALDEGEFYYFDLIGFQVVGDDGKELGSVDNFYENNDQLILVLKINNEIIELPYVDHFFPAKDLAKKILVVNLPEEL